MCAATAHAQMGGDATGRNEWTGTGLRPPLEEAWRALPGEVAGTPVVAGGRVVVATASSVQALDAATGAVAWTAPVTGELAADGSRVFVASASGVTALDLATGAVAWAAKEGGVGPAVAGDRLLVGTASGNLVAYATASGAVRWSTPVFVASGRPAVAGDRVYVAGGCRATALSLATGLPQWLSGTCVGDTGARTVTAGPIVWAEDGAIYSAADGTRLSPSGGPATAGAGLIFANPILNPPATLVAGDAGTFARRWTWTPALPGAVRLRPAVVDGNVFALVDAGGDDGTYLAALDPATGAERWSGFAPVGGSLVALERSALAAGPGVLVLPVPGGVVALRNAAAGALGVAATLPRNVVVAGASTVVTGRLRSGGHGLVGPRIVGLQADPYPFDDAYLPAAAVVAGRGEFSLTATVARNTRFRLAADGVVYAPTTVYAQPSLTVAYARTANKRVVRATVRIAAVDGLRRRGARVAVYRLKRRARVAGRLGAGRSASSGTARFTLHIPGSLKRSDRVFTCLRGASRQGFGVANVIDRRCGAPRIPLPTTARTSTVSPDGRYIDNYATRLPWRRASTLLAVASQE